MREPVKCECTARHVPLPMTYRYLRMGGEAVVLCPTTFENVMDLLTHFKTHGTLPPGSVTKHYSKYVRDVALRLWKENMTT